MDRDVQEILALLRETKTNTEDMARRIEQLSRKMQGFRAAMSNVTYSVVQFKAAIQLLIRDGLIDHKELNEKIEELIKEARSHNL